MAIEAKRGCGYRKVGGLYLVGSGLSMACDRFPMPIIPCPICGEQPRFNRSIGFINPLALWGQHQSCVDIFCPACQPTERGWLMWVGKEYTPSSFQEEAQRLGVSKRLPFIPEGLCFNQDWVFLAYLHLIPTDGHLNLLTGHARGGKPGIFYAFCPQRIEKIITQSQSQDEKAMAELQKAGIVPVIVPDDDPDHTVNRKREKVLAEALPAGR